MPKRKKYEKFLSAVLTLLSLSSCETSAHSPARKLIGQKVSNSKKPGFDLKKLHTPFGIMLGCIVLDWLFGDKNGNKKESDRVNTASDQVPATQLTDFESRMKELTLNFISPTVENIMSGGIVVGQHTVNSNEAERRWNDDYSSIIQKRVGMDNLGASCFFNASYQCLIAEPSFVNTVFGMAKAIFLTSGNIKKLIKSASGKLFLIMCLQFEAGRNNQACVSGEDFRTLVRKLLDQTFRTNWFGQQDAEEFISNLECTLNNENERIRNLLPFKPKVWQVNAHWRHGENKNPIFESSEFHSLDLELTTRGQRVTSQREVSKLFECFCKVEKHEVNENPRYECSLRFLPIVNSSFRIRLMRFEGNAVGSSKDSCPIVPEEEIRLDDKRFALQAIVCHSGELNSGHYWSFVKNNNGYWFKINDRDATIVSTREVIDSQTQKVYILFYRLSEIGVTNTSPEIFIVPHVQT